MSTSETGSPAVGRPSAARRVNDVEYLTSEEVMKVLGIKKASLYTYVSRGLVRSIKQPGQTKANLYLKADVDKLRTRVGAGDAGPVISRSLRYGEPVVQSWICDITPNGPRYRGHLAVDLAESGKSFEYVADLIWGGLPRLRDSPWPPPAEYPGSGSLPAGARSGDTPLSVGRLLVQTALEMTSLERATGDTAYVDGRTAGIRLIQAFAATAGYLGPHHAPQPHKGEQYIASTLLRGLAAPTQDPTRTALLNIALVLSADHELSAPTFVARICASTGVDFYACVIAALMAHSGPMQLGGAADLEALIYAGKDQSLVLQSRDVPCFGHPLYEVDPRAEALLRATSRCASVRKAGRRLLDEIEAERAQSGRYPNLFGALVFMAHALDLPKGSALLVNTVGRTAGWIAHAVEQRHAGAMLRPRAKYMGDRDA